jgi:hypothetical protein
VKHRKLKVARTGDPWKGQHYSQIRLEGRWLREAGFQPGIYVSVEVSPDQLVIKPVQEVSAPAQARIEEKITLCQDS